ncbi:tyrosine--tRNA ligase [Ferroacidibacillus organovorans]|uniref:Tyrosine--tRNA ligase n=1 Tax=Ferroacidibacillus organovorans TaxID=1765683 RepID=A0A162U9U4_9BACL|nr:tyrosine--tRNA ligase [Ferroacidibacillus organovorans]KYP81583.1 tyrosine--tRNA ligase [Ferroacidibacillus organovorans]OAG94121.1 tyrosine--tRNA ligase [Ferroacidibacillus organovorans]OPG15950.1 tyrosine--tRNA ligase [Ferroacidibacillus organovorans]
MGERGRKVLDLEKEALRQLDILSHGAVDVIPKEELLEKLKRSLETKTPLRVKLGLDPTAPDIHIGHTVVLNKLRQFQDLGHHVQLVIGDFTGRIGDPTGKSETRKQLTEEQVQENAATYRAQVFKVLDEERTMLHFNATWLSSLQFAEVLRLGATVTVARMLERDDFKKRFSENVAISIHELFYPLMQAYDSVALETDVELGGTDQTFNLLMGRTLQKEYGMSPQVVITMPLIEGLDGVQKMSKSLGNYIGVDDEPKDMYGKAMSIPDELMVKYLTLVSGLRKDEVEALEAGLVGGTVHPRDAKMKLAHALVTRFHGRTAAELAQEAFVRVFQKRSLPDEIESFALEAERVALVPLLVRAGMAPSNSEARRLIAGGGVKMDGETVNDAALEFEPRTGMVLQVGKRRFIKLDVQG